MKHVKDEYVRTLKYYYKKRNKQQRERWNDILDKVYLDIDAGKMRDDIVDDLMQGGYRLMIEDPRATANKNTIDKKEDK